MYLEDVNRKALIKQNPFLRICIQTLEKRSYGPPKINIGLKTQNFVVISNSLMPPQKMCLKKVKLTIFANFKNVQFYLFIMFCDYSFLWGFFKADNNKFEKCKNLFFCQYTYIILHFIPIKIPKKITLKPLSTHRPEIRMSSKIECIGCQGSDIKHSMSIRILHTVYSYFINMLTTSTHKYKGLRPTPPPLQIFFHAVSLASFSQYPQLKGHGNEADFLGFLHKSVRHRSLTLNFKPFRF